MRNINIRAPFIAVLGLLIAAPSASFGQSMPQGSSQPIGSQAAMEQRVRHSLLMLPYYNVFDNLEFQVDGGHVTLSGRLRGPC